MIGILLLSHGRMAEGMLDTCKLFFGEDVAQIKAICLHADNAPEEFDEWLKQGIEEVDDGHGVIALCDLLFGTPCNRCMYVLNDRVQVITGMNLSLLLELLGKRMMTNDNDEPIDISELDLEGLINTGKEGLVSLNQKVKEMMG